MTKPNHFQVSKQPRVAILAYNNLATFEFSCAVELFSLPRPDIKNWYKTDIISLESGQLDAVGGFRIVCDNVFSTSEGFAQYDMLIIPGWSGIGSGRAISEALSKAITSFYQKGGILVSFCSGAFAIAATGLLNARSATTHWLYEKEFKRNFPKVNFIDNVLFTEENRIYTAAGSASGLDLGIHIIAKDYGITIANKIAKRLVIAPQRQGGQSQFAINPLQTKAPNNLNHSIEWVLDNLHQNISINDMADHACLSRRSFDRHFRNSLGLSPKEWLIKQRISRAREYLENSSSNVEIVAQQCGLGTAMNLRHHFSKILGVSPTHYRRQFLQALQT